MLLEKIVREMPTTSDVAGIRWLRKELGMSFPKARDITKVIRALKKRLGELD